MEFHSKMNSIGEDTINTTMFAIQKVEEEFDGLVVANQGEHFSAGANIMLVLMADRMSMSVGDLFLGAVFPGVLLAGLYIAYLLTVGRLNPEMAPAAPTEAFDWQAIWDLFKAILPPAFLILAVLGSASYMLDTLGHPGEEVK